MNNRTLLLIFITCLALFLGGRFFRGNRTSNFNPVIVAIDTASVDRIRFMSGGEFQEEFELVRTASGWEAIKDDAKIPAQSNAVMSILTPLASLNANRIVARDASRYPEFEINNEAAGRIIVWQGKKQVADLFLGGFRFDQMARTASSFVRKGDSPEVYQTDGFTSMALKARFDQFRDKKLVKANATDLTTLDWMDSANRKEVIQKIDGLWHYAGMEAVDTTAINSYLVNLTNTQGSTFSNLTSTQGLSMIEKLTLHGNNMPESTVLSVYNHPDTLRPFLIHSSANPGVLFTSDSAGLYKRIFTDLRQFWPYGQ